MKKNGYTIVEILIVIVILGLIFAVVPLLGFWTDRNLDFWLSQMKGHPVNVPYWLSLVLTIVTNGLAIIANVIAEIARFAL